jgi:hypothetical protein
MTPLIQKAAALHPNAEMFMWFDVDKLDKWPGGKVNWDIVSKLPYEKTAIVGKDESGEPFSLWLIQGQDSVTVSGVVINTKHYIYPFAYLCEEDGIKYTTHGNVQKKDVEPIFRTACVSLIKLQDSVSKSYKPIAQNSLINRKRKAKGKPAILFDWHTVEIGPKEIKKEHQGGTHASPRLHDRRGHWRKHPSGKSIWVKSCKVGDASKGVVFKDYKVN